MTSKGTRHVSQSLLLLKQWFKSKINKLVKQRQEKTKSTLKSLQLIQQGFIVLFQSHKILKNCCRKKSKQRKKKLVIHQRWNLSIRNTKFQKLSTQVNSQTRQTLHHLNLKQKQTFNILKKSRSMSTTKTKNLGKQGIKS